MADLTRQPEQIRAFRDTWELGIHSYLAYLRDRLVAARELFVEAGVLFVQIGDENVHLVRCLLDEVFGSENFTAQITYAKTTGATVVMLPGTADYILWYCKNKEAAKYRRLFFDEGSWRRRSRKYDRVKLASGETRPLDQEERFDSAHLPEGAAVFRLDNLMSQSMGAGKEKDLLVPGPSPWRGVPAQYQEPLENERSGNGAATCRWPHTGDPQHAGVYPLH